MRFQVIRNAEKRMQAIEVQAIDRIKYPEKKENLIRVPPKAVEIKKPSKTNPWANRNSSKSKDAPSSPARRIPAEPRKNSDPTLTARALFPATNGNTRPGLSAFDSIFHENPLFNSSQGKHYQFFS